MCQICTIAARYSRHSLDRTHRETQVFNLKQFSTAIQTTQSVEDIPTAQILEGSYAVCSVLVAFDDRMPSFNISR